MPHFSALTWRILAFNALALIVLTGGVILVQASGRGLVEERLNSIQEQAKIVAGTIAQYATDPETHTLKVEEAEPLLRQLIAPTRLRGRLYLPGGHLAIDTRNLLARNVVQTRELPSLDTSGAQVNGSSGCMTASWACGPWPGWSPIMKAAMTAGSIARWTPR